MPPDLTFITGNQHKADRLAAYLGIPAIRHEKLELDELQSMDLRKIVEHKARQAHERTGKPVLVEDVALEFDALGGLPGPFVKFFLESMSEQAICDLPEGKERGATARCVFGYFDGERLELIEGSLRGTVAKAPRGDGGFGWDRIFIPEGYEATRAELPEADYEKTYTTVKPFAALKAFLEGLT